MSKAEKKEIKAYCKRRADKAKGLVLNAYDEDDVESSIKDCLTDLMHLAQRHKIDWWLLEDGARNHFHAEAQGGEHG